MVVLEGVGVLTCGAGAVTDVAGARRAVVRRRLCAAFLRRGWGAVVARVGMVAAAPVFFVGAIARRVAVSTLPPSILFTENVNMAPSRSVSITSRTGSSLPAVTTAGR